MSEDKLLEVLNKMVVTLDPIKFEDLNTDWPCADQNGLVILEKEHDEVGLKYVDNDKTKPLCSSVAALIATITDLLVGKRLAFTIDTETGYIVGFQWYVVNND